MSASRRLGWVAVLSLLVAMFVVAAVDDGGPADPAARAQGLSQRFACPECQGQSVAESNAPVALTIREFIAAEVEGGRSDRQIEEDLVRSYGTGVVLSPPSRGFGALAWVLPVLAFTVGATALAWVVTRDRGNAAGPSAEDRALVERARRAR